MSERAREAQLTIGFDGDRVIGELRDEHGVVSAFSGWLELLSALESLAASAPEPMAKQVGTSADPTSVADQILDGNGGAPRARRRQGRDGITGAGPVARTAPGGQP